MNDKPRAGAKRRALGRSVARTVVSALLLALLAWKVPLEGVRSALARVPASGIALAFVVLALQTLVGVARWRRMLMRTGERVPIAALWSDVLVASAYTMVLPSSAGGDVVRALRCARRLREPHRAWSTMVFERVVGVVSLALIALPGIVLVPGGARLLWPSLAIAAAGIIALLGAGAPLRWLGELASRRAPVVATMSVGMARDFAGALGTTGARAEAFAWSIGYQFTGISILTACIAPTHDTALVLAIYAGLPLIAIGAMLPVTIAGVGLRESLFVAVLGRLGVAEPVALALGLLWLGSYVVLALAGLVASWLLPPPAPPGEADARGLAPGRLAPTRQARSMVARSFASRVLVALVAASPLALCPTLAQAQPRTGPAAPELHKPVLETFVEATYPAEARARGLTGKTRLELDLDAQGKVTNAHVVEPSGVAGFDEAAVVAARQFVFAPARRGDTAIPSRISYTYVFALDAEAAAPVSVPTPSTRLRGVVTMSATGEPLEGVRVVVRAPGAAAHELRTSADGSWVIDDLPPGAYRVELSAEGYERSANDEDVEAGQATEVAYRLSPARGAREVVVRGERPPREVTKRTIEQRELARVPGSNGDALRAIQNLPGVARPPGLAGLLIVRGSAPNETEVFIDGTPVPLAYHFGGLSSVVPTEMLSKIDFYPGNFSTQYGRVQGGIVDVGMRGPNADGKYHGLAQADFIDARAMVEGPIPGLSGWSFIAGARRSYVDVWLKPVLEGTGAGVSTAPVYYDYQAFAEKSFSGGSQLRVGVLGSDDRLALLLKDPSASEPLISGDLGLHTGFTKVQAIYRADLGHGTHLSTVTAVGRQILEFNLGSLFFHLTTYPITNRTEISQKLSTGVTLNVGQDLVYTPYDIAIRAPPPPRPGEPSAGPFAARPPLEQRESGMLYRPGAYAEVEVAPDARLRIVPGFRADYTRDTKKWDASPRVNARYVVMPEFPKLAIKGGLGVFHQPPQPQESSRVFGSPDVGSSRAMHYSLGAEQELTKQVDVSVEAFYKQLDGLVSRAPSAGAIGGYAYGNEGSGYVVGSEVLLRYKPDARFFGWVAYTLSRSMRRDLPREDVHLFQYDQTHILTLLGSYRLGGGWEVGARFRLISGSLLTPCGGGVFNSAAGAYACISGAPFSERLPLFHQLDLRVDRRWKYETWQLSAYLDVLNTYNRQNAEGYSYNYNYTQSVYNTGLPIIPSLGLRGEF